MSDETRLNSFGMFLSAEIGNALNESNEYSMNFHSEDSDTFEQRNVVNLLSPSSCILISGNILKKRSTEAKSSSLTASSNFELTTSLS